MVIAAATEIGIGIAGRVTAGRVMAAGGAAEVKTIRDTGVV
jgi:hypothetical protein